MNERVWDRFLTDQDRQALERLPKSPGDPRTYCERPALLMIDFYRSVFGDRPQPLLEAIDQWPGSCGLAAWDALVPTQRLLATCREIGMPIIHTTGMIDGGMQGQHANPEPLEPSSNGRRWIPPAIRYEIMPQVAPIEGESVVHKMSSSAFWGTPLLGHLIKNRIDTLIVCGESTSGCVRATVVDADEYQFNVVLVEDCTFDRHEATHAMNLFDMHRKFADVLGIDEVLTYLKEYSSTKLVKTT